MPHPSKIIMHLDINAFFASCHQAEDPKLRNKPIVVCKNAIKGIVTAASYETRHKGISSGMPIFKVLKLMPNVIIVKPQYDLYKKYSQILFNFLRKKYKVPLETASIDECYMDITDLITHKSQIMNIALDMQKNVLQKINLPCSIGVSYNRFLAKMASNFKKPMGITIITPQNFKQIIWPLSIHKMHGVGKQTSKMMVNNNILTIGDLANYNLNFLINEYSHRIDILPLKQLAKGYGSSEVQKISSLPKSISQQQTLLQPSSDYSELKTYVSYLTESVVHIAQKANVIGDVVQISLRYKERLNNNIINKQNTLNQKTCDVHTLNNATAELLDSTWNGNKIDLIRITLKNLQNQGFCPPTQLSILDNLDTKNLAEMQINDIIKDINQEFKKIILIKLKENNVKSKR